MISSTRIITNPEQQHKPYGKEVVCPDCGHVWYSRGKGKWYICPECEKKKKGFERGKHFKETRGLKMTVTGQDYVQKEPAEPQHQENQRIAQGGKGVSGEENLLRRILKKPLLKI